MSFDYSKSEWYAEYRAKMRIEYQQGKKEQDRIIEWLQSIVNQLGHQIMKWSQWVQSNEIVPKGV